MAGFLYSLRRPQLPAPAAGSGRLGEYVISALLGVLACGFTEGLAVIVLGALVVALVVTRSRHVLAATLGGAVILAVTVFAPGNSVRLAAFEQRPSMIQVVVGTLLFLRGAFAPPLPAYGLCLLLGAATGTITIGGNRLIAALLTFLGGVGIASATLLPVVMISAGAPDRALLPAQLIFASTAFLIGSILWHKKQS